MTTKPTIEAYITGTLHVVSTAEWNTNILQAANYIFEVLAGTNADKIPATALSALTLTSVLGSAVTLNTTVGVFSDGPSLALTAGGTWFVIGFCCVFNGVNETDVARVKLQDSGGVTVYANQRASAPANAGWGAYATIALAAPAVPGGTTVKISASQDTHNAGMVMENLETYIVAMRNGG